MSFREKLEPIRPGGAGEKTSPVIFVTMDALEPNRKPPKALVIRLSSMGDVVLATSVLFPLRQAGFEIAFVTKRAFAPLLEGHPDLAEVYSFDASGGEGAARADFFRWAEARDFSLVLDLQDSWRTRFWRSRLQRHATVRVARKERLREWLILYLRLGHWLSFGRGGRARKFRRLAADALAAQQIFSPSEGPLTSLHVSEAEKEAVRPMLPPGDFALVIPGSAWRGKEWPYFPELATVLARRVPVVALGAAKDEACDRVAREAGGVSLRGRTSLRQSLAVVAQAKWIIGNDTGLLHGAEALGKDVAMLEGPTHERMGFSPYRARSLLLGLDLICRPCSKSGRICPRLGTRKCLYGLSAQAVIEKLRAWGWPC